MKILITGASGYLGTMLRQFFANHELSLLSRKPVTPGNQEKWFRSGSLWDTNWWGALPADSQFDVVFHLAEVVKENVGESMKQDVVDGHVRFISHFADRGTKVVYPLTAYLYDRRLSRANAQYAEIKRRVYRQLKDNSRVSFPVVHPISDSGFGLGKLIQTEKRIPLVNLMCAFDSTIPVLRLAHLQEVFADPASIAPGRLDIFSEIGPMKQLFRDNGRSDVRLLSIAARHVLQFLEFVPSFNLLVKGRRIDDWPFL